MIICSLGLGIGPLLEYVIHVDPSIIPTAFLASTLIFTSFSISALFADRGKWLYLGGTLMSLLSVLMLMSLANIFIGSDLIFKVCLFILINYICCFKFINRIMNQFSGLSLSWSCSNEWFYFIRYTTDYGEKKSRR